MSKVVHRRIEGGAKSEMSKARRVQVDLLVEPFGKSDIGHLIKL